MQVVLDRRVRRDAKILAFELIQRGAKRAHTVDGTDHPPPVP
jgi:hypothetical protein